MNHKSDTDEMVCFYEQEFYVLSNFSAFNVEIWRRVFQTSEHAYHWRKFGHIESPYAECIQGDILNSRSAHDAFKIARRNADHVYSKWDEVKVDHMREILWAKVRQHEYVKKKLLETGDRRLVEDSWRDSYWGWGPNKDGKNVLGELWMDIRSELRKDFTLGYNSVHELLNAFREWNSEGRERNTSAHRLAQVFQKFEQKILETENER